MKFAELGLRPELVRAIADEGYETPTPIQLQAIPVALKGQDVLGVAQTGTGKTASFVLPLLQRLAESKRVGNHPRALIVTPTRELAAQIGERATAYGRHLQITSTTIFGGVGMEPQTAKLRRGVDIVIATPGRLLDHLERRNVSLHGIETLVLDEADRMLDMGFLPDVKRILAKLPVVRQNLFFSATMPSEIQDLIQRTMKAPVVVEVARRATPAELVKQVVHPVDGDSKRELLAKLLESREMTSVLVFTRTKVRADRLAKYLTQGKTGRNVAAIHGNKSQGARTRALDGFRSGKVDTLIATDIAARGIDVEAISHVINFDIPNVAEDYVHRIGRTARAGASGHAISLVAGEEMGFMRAIEKLMGREVPRVPVDGFPVPAQSSARPVGMGSPPGQRRTGPRVPSGTVRGAAAHGRHGTRSAPLGEKRRTTHGVVTRPEFAQNRSAAVPVRPRSEPLRADRRPDAGQRSRPAGRRPDDRRRG